MFKWMVLENNNNNDLFEEVFSAKCQNDNNNIIHIVFRMFMKTKCKICSNESEVINENAKHFSKEIHQTSNRKIVKMESEEPNSSKTSKKVLHCAALVTSPFILPGVC